MAKRKIAKILVKPYLMEKYLNNSVNEKVQYIQLPEDYENYPIEEAVKKDGIHYNDLLKLTSKENISRIVSITADNCEMGLMAVSYLAMYILNRNGMSPQMPLFENDGGEELWVEDEMKIPVISIIDILRYMRRKDTNPFAPNGFMYSQSAATVAHKPYWCSCTRDFVCIIVKRCDVESGCMDYLNLFSQNRNVFVIFLSDEDSTDFMEDMPFLSFDEKHFIGLRNNFILSSASDAVTVSFGDDNGQAYYKNILRQNMKQRNIKIAKGFLFDRVVNLARATNKTYICQMIDKIINYAVKDMDRARTLSNSSFEFVDHFAGTCAATVEKNAKEQMERELIGLSEVKQQVYDIVNVMKYNKMRDQMKISGSHFHNVHLMIGAPGTAKTTVAKYMGQIMVDEKLLHDNRVICINGAELKGMYVGHSAPKTRSIFENYDVIIIDEAYSIVESDGSVDSFGNEAIAQLIIELEKHSTDKLVIFAGYGGDVTEKDNKMLSFLDSNPGIKSRITSTFYFKSYTAEQMAEIFERIASNSNFEIKYETKEIVEKYFRTRVNDNNFGNGREARALLETSMIFAAKRTMAAGKEKYSAKELKELCAEDVKMAIHKLESDFGNQEGTTNKIGFAC